MAAKTLQKSKKRKKISADEEDYTSIRVEKLPEDFKGEKKPANPQKSKKRKIISADENDSKPKQVEKSPKDLKEKKFPAKDTQHSKSEDENDETAVKTSKNFKRKFDKIKNNGNDSKAKRVEKSPKDLKVKKSPVEDTQYGKSEDENDETPVKVSKKFKRKFDKVKNKGDKSDYVTPAAKGSKLDRKKWKEMTEERKRKRKPYFDLQKELVASWEKMRQRNIKTEERSNIISETLNKMEGKIPDIAGSHISSRVLQTCIKYCQPAERDSVYKELRPHFLKLACNTYAVHLITKMLDHANKKQLCGMISSLHGHVTTFLRHPVGSAVVEHAFKLGNATQKQDLLSEIYSAEFRLFKGIMPKGKNRLVDLLSGELPSKKSAVLEHMSSALQPILEKGIVDHSIVHRALVEYMSVADKSSVADMIQQLSGPLLVRMIHTRDGSKVGTLCVIHGNAKERKKIVKGMKGHVVKICKDEYGSVVLLCILNFVDDTNVVTKIIIREIEQNLKELTLDKYGRRPLLHLLCPDAPRYFPPEVLATLRSTITPLSISTKELLPKSVDNEPSGNPEGPSETASLVDVDADNDQHQTTEHGHEEDPEESDRFEVFCKKDPYKRRCELLIKSGLAKKLGDACIKNVGELLRSQYGKDIIYEIASGGAEGFLWKKAASTVTSLHRAIADLGALPKENDETKQTEEHVFIQYHSSRTIRKLILESTVPDRVDAPSFASVLWKVALKGKCEMWVEGYSEKVVSALMNTPDLKVKNMAKSELQPLIDAGKLKISNDNNV